MLMGPLLDRNSGIADTALRQGVERGKKTLREVLTERERYAEREKQKRLSAFRRHEDAPLS
jgi:hypothetical protein